MIQKSASATWSGSLKDGGGTISTGSGALSAAPFTFATRFENGKGTNPEELIGAAHAACYAMFLSALMGGAGITPEAIAATSTVTLDPATPGSPTVTRAHLAVSIRAPAEPARIEALAAEAKAGCPISKLLKAEITLEVTLG